eukprot:scaffold14574_cov38-Cyclotella_meneghiniana.AAC.2
MLGGCGLCSACGAMWGTRGPRLSLTENFHFPSPCLVFGMENTTTSWNGMEQSSNKVLFQQIRLDGRKDVTKKPNLREGQDITATTCFPAGGGKGP